MKRGGAASAPIRFRQALSTVKGQIRATLGFCPTMFVTDNLDSVFVNVIDCDLQSAQVAYETVKKEVRRRFHGQDWPWPMRVYFGMVDEVEYDVGIDDD